jgi:Mor family transcriptional regulator
MQFSYLNSKITDLKLKKQCEKEVKPMEKLMDVAAADLAGVYKEVAETVGVENAYKLYRHFRGLQMLFPLRFYSNEYIAKQICDDYDGKNVRDLARKYGYSESRVRQILRDAKAKK